MKIGDFEITCIACGSKDVEFVDVMSKTEDYVKIKCKNCENEVEV